MTHVPFAQTEQRNIPNFIVFYSRYRAVKKLARFVAREGRIFVALLTTIKSLLCCSSKVPMYHVIT
jgi:hypothetical protein